MTQVTSKPPNSQQTAFKPPPSIGAVSKAVASAAFSDHMMF